MTKTSEWLAAYEKAWRSKDPADVREVFADDAEYRFRPDDPEPTRGIDAIIEMWPDEPVEPVHELSVLVESDDIGIVSGWVDYPGHQRYSNLWEVHFAPDGRAQLFVEWFMTPREAAVPASDDPQI